MNQGEDESVSLLEKLYLCPPLYDSKTGLPLFLPPRELQHFFSSLAFPRIFLSEPVYLFCMMQPSDEVLWRPFYLIVTDTAALLFRRSCESYTHTRESATLDGAHSEHASPESQVISNDCDASLTLAIVLPLILIGHVATDRVDAGTVALLSRTCRRASFVEEDDFANSDGISSPRTTVSLCPDTSIGAEIAHRAATGVAGCAHRAATGVTGCAQPGACEGLICGCGTLPEFPDLLIRTHRRTGSNSAVLPSALVLTICVASTSALQRAARSLCRAHASPPVVDDNANDCTPPMSPIRHATPRLADTEVPCIPLQAVSDVSDPSASSRAITVDIAKGSRAPQSLSLPCTQADDATVATPVAATPLLDESREQEQETIKPSCVCAWLPPWKPVPYRLSDPSARTRLLVVPSLESSDHVAVAGLAPLCGVSSKDEDDLSRTSQDAPQEFSDIHHGSVKACAHTFNIQAQRASNASLRSFALYQLDLDHSSSSESVAGLECFALHTALFPTGYKMSPWAFLPESVTNERTIRRRPLNYAVHACKEKTTIAMPPPLSPQQQDAGTRAQYGRPAGSPGPKLPNFLSNLVASPALLLRKKTRTAVYLTQAAPMYLIAAIMAGRVFDPATTLPLVGVDLLELQLGHLVGGMIHFAGKVDKYRVGGGTAPRTMLISNRALYMLEPPPLGFCARCIPLNEIVSVVLSTRLAVEVHHALHTSMEVGEFLSSPPVKMHRQCATGPSTISSPTGCPRKTFPSDLEVFMVIENRSQLQSVFVTGSLNSLFAATIVLLRLCGSGLKVGAATSLPLIHANVFLASSTEAEEAASMPLPIESGEMMIAVCADPFHKTVDILGHAAQRVSALLSPWRGHLMPVSDQLIVPVPLGETAAASNDSSILSKESLEPSSLDCSHNTQIDEEEGAISACADSILRFRAQSQDFHENRTADSDAPTMEATQAAAAICASRNATSLKLLWGII